MQFWELTPAEITDFGKVAKARMKWEAALAYMQVQPLLENPPAISEAFPGLFDDIPQIPQWKLWQARVAAHVNDYKRNRGDT